ncbi:hypothetical protein [Nocardia sp. NPDC050435]|uniref:hypothetical protein n=1 Tax=Nocardia sp. NPDC050435 TaxID=3155040 RepID=UPI0033D30A75
MNHRTESYDLDQQAPQWLAWRARIESEVTDFVRREMPAYASNPWCREGLLRAEEIALHHFPTAQSLWLPQRREITDQLSMYLGEALRRTFCGEWSNRSHRARWHDDLGPTIGFPFTTLLCEIRDDLEVAVQDRTGHHWAAVWDGYLGYAREWRKYGSPPPEQWELAGWEPPEDKESRRDSDDQQTPGA